MFNSPFVILIAILMLIVLIILMVGIGAFAKGGEFHKRNSNRLMRYRIAAQAVAVLLILAFAWFRSTGGN